MRKHIIVMITLTSDKLILIKARFPIKDPVHQGPDKSTPKQTASPGGLTPPLPSKKQFEAMPAYTMQWDGTTPVRRLCTLARQLQFIDRCQWQRTSSTSPREA
jgi:hypothetical protein